MAQQRQLASPLKIVVQKLSETPPAQLPYITPYLIELVVVSRSHVEARQPQSSKKASRTAEANVILHSFKTRLTALLQDKSPLARWSAVVLVKTFIEVGGHEALQGCGTWVRTLVGLIGHKTEHSTVKKAAVTTLTSIFFLTHGFPILVREITTQALQSFISHCLNTISFREDSELRAIGSWRLVKTVFQSFLLLLPRHPASFRPHVNALRKLLSHLVAPTPSCAEVGVKQPPVPIVALARRLLSLLPHCAAKNASADEWSRDVEVVLNHITRTADHVFRAIQEDRTPSSGSQAYLDSVKNYGEKVGDGITDLLDLVPWWGIDAGCERLLGLLRILESYLCNTYQHSLKIPIYAIWDIVDRLLSIYHPYTNLKGEEIQPDINPEVERDERESLWLHLPRVHEATLSLLSVLQARMGSSSMVLRDLSLDRVVTVFERNHDCEAIRCRVFEIGAEILDSNGDSARASCIGDIAPLAQAACQEIDSSLGTLNEVRVSTQTYQIKGQLLLESSKSPSQADSKLSQTSTDSSIQQAALHFLRAVLNNVPSQYISSSLRTNIDRSVILTQSKDGLIASVLNPGRELVNGKIIPSNLPFLARAHPENDAVEALLRPRLPVIWTAARPEPAMEMQMDDIGSAAQDNNSRYRSSIHSPPSRSQQALANLDYLESEAQQHLDIQQENGADEILPMSPKRPRARSPATDMHVDPQRDTEPPSKRIRESLAANSDIDEVDQVAKSTITNPLTQIIVTSARPSSELVNPVTGNAEQEEDDDDSSDIPSIDVPSTFEDSDAEIEDDPSTNV